MTYSEAIRYGQKFLDGAESKNETVLLLEGVTGKTMNDFLLFPNEILCFDEEKKFEEWLCRRKNNEPVQYIIGKAPFFGLEFLTNRNVLIPRFDTETLVEETLKVLKKGDSILDMCTGTGCILVSVLKNMEEVSGTGVDIDSSAVELAKKNIEYNGVFAKVIQSNLFENITGVFDVIVSNPPYIETKVIEELESQVKDFEPELALDGGADGLEFYRRIARDSKAHLKGKGALLLEIGYNQGKAVSDILTKEGFSMVKVIKDLCGNDRVVSAVYGG